MSHIVKRSILLLLTLSFMTSVTIFTFTHRGVTHAASSLTPIPGLVPFSVYFGSDNDAFYALDASHGYLRWQYQYQQGGNTWSPAIVANNKIYVEVANSASTAVQALRNIDGAVHWSFTFPALTFGKAAIAVANNIVYFAVDSNTAAGIIYALDGSKGTVLWTYTAPSADQSFGNPIVDNGVVYSAETSSVGGNPHLYALNATSGSLIWANPIPGNATTNLAAFNGVLYFSGAISSLYAISEANGSVVWSSQVDGGAVSTPTPTAGTIYYSSANSFVTAVSSVDGSLLWHFQVKKPFTANVSPVWYSKNIYIGSMDQNMYAINASTGALVWQHKVGVPITTTAAIKLGIIHVGLQRGSLRTLNTSNGVERWYYHTNGVIATSSPPAEG
jgi:eukaryotic-like serine/threonine-protein kinase